MDISSGFASNIKALRMRSGMKQSEFCTSFSLFCHKKDVLPISTLSSWETGSKRPKYETLILLSKFLNVSTDYLIGNSTTTKGEATAIPLAHNQNELTEIKADELANYDGAPILIQYSDGLTTHKQWGIYNLEKDVFRCSNKTIKNSPFFIYFSIPTVICCYHRD